MHHVIVSREYPPAPYPTGGIGTYVDRMSRLLAERGEMVHVIAQRWPAAARPIECRMDGRLTIHRVTLDEPLPHAPASDETVLRKLVHSAAPCQAFSWQVSRMVEHLAEHGNADVVEGQEYEAPLYHLLRRRHEGSRAPVPPVLVHLHTPSEFLRRFNGTDSASPADRLNDALEEYVIRSADALLCPSQFLAVLVSERYSLPRDAIRVVPYPVGEMPLLSRSDAVWAAGSLCFVGRLEPRKGIRELTAAVTSLAHADRSLQLLVIGEDAVHWGTGAPSMREVLTHALPSAARRSIQFVGPVARSALPRYLQQSRIGVVPSLFENFPNSCIEFMASGLPVVVSPDGGMVEMVRDGTTGWIAAASDARSLETTLRRALATAPADLRRMGTAAAGEIRQICDNEEIGRSHVEFRRHLVNRAALLPGDPECIQQLDRLGHAIDDLAASVPAGIPSVRTLSLADVIRAPRRQQLALLRRACADPAYIGSWLWWQARRMTRRVVNAARGESHDVPGAR
jgi:glycosyltransferase involved in cell wall biosynthesis